MSAGEVVDLGDGRTRDGEVREFYLKKGQTVSGGCLLYLVSIGTLFQLMPLPSREIFLWCLLAAACTRQTKHMF